MKNMEIIDTQLIQLLIPGLSKLVPLGRGGQKIVYRGLHQKFGYVVIKLVSNLQPDRRVQREIELAIACSIPNTAKLYDWGIKKHGENTYMYIIEEFIDGVTLRQELRRSKSLPVKTVINLLEALLDITIAMEKEGIVHRDIKPENIMVCRDGTFKLLDFGIARHLAKTSITPTEAPFGPHTAGYAAPEQFRNLKKEVDIRADLFAIGVVAYECLSGVHPFAEGARDCLDILSRTEYLVPPLLVIPEDLDNKLANFINILMSKYPSRRPPSAVVAKKWFDSIKSSIVII